MKTTASDWINILLGAVIAGCMLFLVTEVRNIDSRIAALVTPVPPDHGPTPPGPIPGPVSDFVDKGKAYHQGASAEFAALRDQVKNGTITTGNGITSFMKQTADPFNAAVRNLISANTDSQGKITNPGVLATEFDALAKGLK